MMTSIPQPQKPTVPSGRNGDQCLIRHGLVWARRAATKILMVVHLAILKASIESRTGATRKAVTHAL